VLFQKGYSIAIAPENFAAPVARAVAPQMRADLGSKRRKLLAAPKTETRHPMRSSSLIVRCHRFNRIQSRALRAFCASLRLRGACVAVLN